MIGKTLGHYQITRQLGKGGMGEVFQAKDQKPGCSLFVQAFAGAEFRLKVRTKVLIPSNRTEGC
jgi:hypothetical protein